MPELSLASLVDMMKEQLAACEAGQREGFPQLRAETLELEVALAVVPGEDGQARVALAEHTSNASGDELHRARIAFKVNPGLGWARAGSEAGVFGDSSDLPPSRQTLLPEPMSAASESSADPDFNQEDFDRMMDDIEGGSKKKKKRKKS